MVAETLTVKSTFPPSRGHLRTKSAVRQAIDMQRRLLKDALQEDSPKDRSTAARVWCDLNEEIRKMRMKPVPRPIDTTKLPKRGARRAAAGSSEPVEPKA